MLSTQTLRLAQTALTSTSRVELHGKQKPPNYANWRQLKSLFPGSGQVQEVLRTESFPSSNSRPRHKLQTAGAQSVCTHVSTGTHTHAYLKRLPPFPHSGGQPLGKEGGPSTLLAVRTPGQVPWATGMCRDQKVVPSRRWNPGREGVGFPGPAESGLN